MNASTHIPVLNRLLNEYRELFLHDGFGEIRIEMRILKRGQKEVILHCGKQYRFLLDYSNTQPLKWGIWQVIENKDDDENTNRECPVTPAD